MNGGINLFPQDEHEADRFFSRSSPAKALPDKAKRKGFSPLQILIAFELVPIVTSLHLGGSGSYIMKMEAASRFALAASTAKNTANFATRVLICLNISLPPFFGPSSG